MKLDKIKDIIEARYKFIASNAARIVDIAQTCGESCDLSKETLDEIDLCIDDIGANLLGFRILLKALKESGFNEGT